MDEVQRLIGPLRHWARVSEDRPFLTFRGLHGAPEQQSYGSFYDRVRRLSAGLRASGLRPGERCVVHTGNTPGFLLAFWALQELGAVAVPTIAKYSVGELRQVVRDSGAWGVIAKDDLLPTVLSALEGLRCRLVVEGEAPTGESTLEELVAAGDLTVGRPEADVGELALILYTSGTTARPKGVMLGNPGAVYTATSYAQHLRLTTRDTVLCCMPLFHVNALFLQMAAAVVAGCRLVVTPRFSASRYWTWVAADEVTVGHLISGPVRLLLAAAESAGERDHALRVMTFGLPLDDAEIAAFGRRFGIDLTMVWGLTETCCGGTLMPLGFGSRPGLQEIGPAMIGWEVRAVDERLAELPPGELGELVVRSPGVMLGYHRDPEATASTVVDGWVRSGDLGYRDEAGYFHFVERMKDMLKPDGENVAASEVESVILGHPGVAECAVVGVPDPIRTETVVALVVPAAGASPGADEIRALCAERLAAFKVPTRVELRHELPKTSIGKIRKGDLRRELTARARSGP